MMLGILVLVVVFIVLAIIHNWRLGLSIALIWLIFEDLPRKYLGNNMVIYFGKDLLIGVAYLAFLLDAKRTQRQTLRPPFRTPLLWFVCLGFFQVFNPNSPSIVYGLLGLKLYFYYTPLMFLGYALLRSEEDLRRFLVRTLCIAGVVALLGIIQAILGPDFLNPTMLAAELENLGRLFRAAPISGVMLYRPTSVFVSDGRFALYLILMFLLAFGTTGYMFLRGYRGKDTLVVFLALGFIVTATVLSGGRGVFMYTLGSTLVLIAAFSWGVPQLRYLQARVRRTVRHSLAAASIGLLVILLYFPDALYARWAFYVETLSPQSPQYEITYRATDYPINNLLAAFSTSEWPVGYGIGTASLGGQYITRYFQIDSTVPGVESGYGTLVVELGIVGLLLWLAWTVALVRSGWRVVRQLRGTALFPVGFAIFWFAFLLLFPFTYGGMQPYQNFVFNAYLWLLVGILFRLPELSTQGQTPGKEHVRIPARVG